METGLSTNRPAAPPEAPAVTRELAPPRESMRVPVASPLAPVAGWFTAWGAAVLAVGCLAAAGVETGLGLGVASGVPGQDGLWPGLRTLLVQAAAFVVGGYVAARMARVRAVSHAVLGWVLAMLATGADAIEGLVRDPSAAVLAGLELPHWADTGLSGDWEAAIALTAVALAALAGALIGGALGATANRVALLPAPATGEPAQETAVLARTRESPYPAAPPPR